LAVVAVSHPHPDHYLGVLTPARRVVVGEVWDNGVQPRPPDWRALRQELAARGTRLRTPASLCKAPWRAGGASIALLAPCPPLADASANDNSLVLRVAYGEHRAVLLGDAERAAERRLLQSGRLRRSDFVKVGHHGSATSSSAALVAALAPRVVAISCGIRNRFGHPHRKVLAAWRRHGAVVGRTDRHGALWWRSDGTRARWGDARSPPFGASLREWLRRVLQ
jgi:competence protein ComEC